MSHTMELLAEVQHGTVTGYRAGCHGSAVSCGAVVSCATVYTRYQGDWGFRRRVDAGEDPAAIYAAELAEVEAVRARDLEAQRKARAAANRSARAVQPRVKTGQGFTDRGIASELGVSMTWVGELRREAGLKANRRAS